MPVVGPPMGSAQPMGYYPGPPQPSPAVYHGGPPPNMGYGPGGGGNGAPPPPQVSDHVENAKKRHDYEALCHIINQWNANRLDLFALSLPNEHLEFHGVMRFYYQSADMGSGQKVATKCIRVSSTAVTREIIETLIEKFRPDMKMLEVPEYALYEIHESGERKLNPEEKPLLVQLNWHKDDREGRFLLRRIDEPTIMSHQGKEKTAEQMANSDPTFKRKLSKREKKELKKAEKLAKNTKNKVNGDEENGGDGVAEKLYTELPDTSFTRSISNPEAVMRRRRQQKLEKKLQQFRSRDGGPDTGGTLKIYGESIRKDVPYKTLLLSVVDPAIFVVEEMLEKYGLDRKEAPAFCLIQVTSPPNSEVTNGGHSPADTTGGNREYYLEDEECPLNILMHHSPSRGTVTFHVRRRPAELYPRKRKKKPMAGAFGQFNSESALMSDLPIMVELNVDGSDIHSRLPQRFRLSQNVTEVGSDPNLAVHSGGHALLLPQSPFIHPRHCVVAHTEPGVVTVTPSHPEAETYVNQHRITETTFLTHGCAVRFGRNHVFRFLDPPQDLRSTSSVTLPPPASSSEQGGQVSEGNYAYFPPGGRTVNGYPRPGGQPLETRGSDNILPAVLEFREDTEDSFFSAITMGLDVNAVQFKLAPTYTIYMATRFRASTHYRPELIPEERAIRLTAMLDAVSDCIFGTVDHAVSDSSTLAFWMANSSELLHFLKSDRHITAFSLRAQDILAETVHNAFKFLVEFFQAELEMCMPGILSESEDDDQATQGIMKVLTFAMGLLRKCRVNAALTIQLFSQLFHYINMWTFNEIVNPEAKNYCTHRWGMKIKKRMGKVEQWAEKQGLELAADCHLARVVQAAHLLQARKNTAEDIASVSSICFKLNSVQLRTLLDLYEPSPDERPISREMIDTIVRVAENTVDEVTLQENREVRLEEDLILQLPFLLPEDGYSCDIVKGVPSGLTEFIAPLQRAGLCVMTPQPTSLGFWTIYMENMPPMGSPPMGGRSPSELSLMNSEAAQPHPAQMQHLQQMQHQRHLNGPPGPPGGPLPGPPGPPGSVPNPNEPEISAIKLVKAGGGMGLSIVAAKGVGKDKLGIYVKAVVDNGAAHHDGRLQPGDQLLKVDGTSLVGITQDKAAEIMMHTGPVVELEVAKQGAIFHGLQELLARPSPLLSPRGRPGSTQPQQWIQGQPPQEQHLYQNHRPGPPQQMMSPMQRPPSGMRSASIQNLSHHQQQQHIAQQMGQRQGSHPALMNGGLGPHGPPGPQQQQTLPRVNGDDQGYYQNIGTTNLQQPMPLRYNNGPQQQGPPSAAGPPPQTLLQQQQQQRYGSQTSLQPPPPHTPQPRVSNDVSPMIYHATPRIVGTPQSSAGGGGPPPRLVNIGSANLTPTGPEKPQRTYEDNNNKPRSISQGNPPRGVRFQDPNDDKVNDVNSYLEQLRLSSVEREFRKRIAGNKQNDGESGSDGEEARNLVNGKLDNLRRLEAKKNELEKEEERILKDAISRRKSGTDTPTGSDTDFNPPPLPQTPPPGVDGGADPADPGYEVDPHEPFGAAQRLDALISTNLKTNGHGTHPSQAERPPQHERSKKVSFASSAEPLDEIPEITLEQKENLSRLERYEKDPNAFIKEAESLLNTSTIEKFNKATGHTPSVIGAQEVYRDPRMKMMAQKKAEEEDRKSSVTKSRDGAKLSFQEKMELFAVGNEAAREKAKISKAQREIDGENNPGSGTGSGSGNSSTSGNSPQNNQPAE